MNEQAFDELLRFLAFQRHEVERAVVRRFFITPRDAGLRFKIDAERRFEASYRSERPRSGLVLAPR